MENRTTWKLRFYSCYDRMLSPYISVFINAHSDNEPCVLLPTAKVVSERLLKGSVLTSTCRFVQLGSRIPSQRIQKTQSVHRQYWYLSPFLKWTHFVGCNKVSSRSGPHRLLARQTHLVVIIERWNSHREYGCTRKSTWLPQEGTCSSGSSQMLKCSLR